VRLCTPSRHVSMYSSRPIAFFEFGACRCNVERLEAADKQFGTELAFRIHTLPLQEDDAAEEDREV
jgi:hypothetical protein